MGLLMDPAFGADVGLRTALSELGLPYVAGILSRTTTQDLYHPSPICGALDGPPSACAAMRRTGRLCSRISLQLALQGLEDHHLARGDERAAQIALRPSAHSHCKARLRAQRTLAGRMAFDRVARG
jgi:hypothetical protein